MKSIEEICNILKDKFPDYEIQLNTEYSTDNFLILKSENLFEIALFLRDNEETLFDSLMVLSGVDDANGEKKKEEDGSETINGGTLSVFYHLYSIKLKHKLTLKVSSPRENPEIVSVSSIWLTADWHEREAYDMYGIRFLNHPDLRRILMPYDWEGYPLRKDYKNPEFYQGMKIPY
ncbi:MAG TPA: NADH-quinone oxidoreductase subunit C [Melioribacteraceae bacterium]|nr:NADH-quinone oxidoreductase subunit C [Melioribacteraceae bacterium]